MTLYMYCVMWLGILCEWFTEVIPLFSAFPCMVAECACQLQREWAQQMPWCLIGDPGTYININAYINIIDKLMP